MTNFEAMKPLKLYDLIRGFQSMGGQPIKILELANVNLAELQAAEAVLRELELAVVKVAGGES